jgi:glucose dehydrogenase
MIDRVVNGRMRKLVVQANRNAFYYVLDRGTGEFLHGAPYVKQTWGRKAWILAAVRYDWPIQSRAPKERLFIQA